MKLLAFSDLHRDLDGAARLVEKSADADVVIAAGDFANQHDGLEETIDALKPIATPTILVPGNNETEDALRAACEGWEAATVLHGGSAELNGTTFFGLGGGTPITPWDWSYDLAEDEAREKLAGCPDGPSSSPTRRRKGHVDEGLGSEAILEAIEGPHSAGRRLRPHPLPVGQRIDGRLNADPQPGPRRHPHRRLLNRGQPPTGVRPLMKVSSWWRGDFELFPSLHSPCLEGFGRTSQAASTTRSREVTTARRSSPTTLIGIAICCFSARL